MTNPAKTQYDRAAAADYLTSIGCWTISAHLSRLARLGAAPAFVIKNGEVFYSQDDLRVFAAETISMRKRRRIDRRAK